MQRLPRYAPNVNLLRLPPFEAAWYGSDVPLERIEALYANRLLDGYTRETLARCLAWMRYARLPPQAVVTDTRCEPQRIFLVLEGRVALHTRRGSGAPAIDVLHAGDFFGEASALRLPRHTSVSRCLEATSLCSIDASLLLHSLRPSSLLGLNIARALHRRLQRSLAHLDYGVEPCDEL